MSILKKTKDTKEHVDLDRYRQKKRKWWLWLPLLLVGLVGAWVLLTTLLALRNSTVGNTDPSLAILKNKGAQENVNVLLIGIGGENHPGGTLADSIMVASINVRTKHVSLLSIPRDLYVTIPNGGGKDKINAVHAYGERTKGVKGGGPALLKEVVATVTGVPIHYFVRVDFEGFTKIIDTVGGVTVTVPKAINDPRYPDKNMKGYDPFSITAGTHKLDGKTALKYVRSRESTSDFDRARRQQQVLSALKDKVLSAQVLANPKKVTDIISVLGKHILTDISAGEINQLITIAKEMSNPTIKSYVIDNGEDGLLVSSRAANGASILLPRAGASDYADIHVFVKGYFAASDITKETPTIELRRSSGTSKEVSAKVSKQLEAAGFTVTEGTNVPVTETKTTLYRHINKPKKATEAFLKSAYGVTPQSSSAGGTADYVFILASDFSKIIKSHATTADVTNATPPPLLSDGSTTFQEDTAGQSRVE